MSYSNRKTLVTIEQTLILSISSLFAHSAFDELAFDEALELALEARLDGTGVAKAASK